MRSALEWRELYAEERAAFGDAGLDALVRDAADVRLPPRGALIFPHTFLAKTGSMVAAVARAVVASGADEVLALGVLHGGRASATARTASAREGNRDAIAELRRVHDGGVSSHAAEEYSLDNFVALVDSAARVAGKRAPEVHVRYPFLVGGEPSSLPGLEDVARFLDRGVPMVATADPIHHGAGYGTEESEQRSLDDGATLGWAREIVARQYELLALGDYAEFQHVAAACHSDFRDAGPVLAFLLRTRGEIALTVRDLVLVDYAESLSAPPPTWVAGALGEAALA